MMPPYDFRWEFGTSEDGRRADRGPPRVSMLPNDMHAFRNPETAGVDQGQGHAAYGMAHRAEELFGLRCGKDDRTFRSLSRSRET